MGQHGAGGHRLDGTFVALDAKTGNLVWQTLVGRWQDGYTIVSAPLYHNGVIYTGISGGDRGGRGKLVISYHSIDELEGILERIR